MVYEPILIKDDVSVVILVKMAIRNSQFEVLIISHKLQFNLLLEVGSY